MPRPVGSHSTNTGVHKLKSEIEKPKKSSRVINLEASMARIDAELKKNLEESARIKREYLEQMGSNHASSGPMISEVIASLISKIFGKPGRKEGSGDKK